MEKIAVFKFADEEYYYDPEYDILSIYNDEKMVRKCKLEEFYKEKLRTATDFKNEFLYKLFMNHRAAYIFETRYENNTSNMNEDFVKHGWRIQSVTMPRFVLYDLEKDIYEDSPESKIRGVMVDTLLEIEFDPEGNAVKDSIYDAINTFESAKKYLKGHE